MFACSRDFFYTAQTRAKFVCRSCQGPPRIHRAAPPPALVCRVRKTQHAAGLRCLPRFKVIKNAAKRPRAQLSAHLNWISLEKKISQEKKKKKTASLVPNKSYLWAYLKRDGPNQQKHIFCSSSCCWGLLGLALFSSKNAAWASQTLHSVCKEWMHSVPRCGQQTCLQLLMLWRYCFAFLTA